MLHCTIPVLARENAQRYPRVRAHLSVAFARLKAPLAPRPMVCNAAADTVTGIPLACVVVAAPPPEPRKHVTVLGGFTKAKRSAKPKHHKVKSLSTSQARKPVHMKHLFSHTLGVNDASRALHTNTHPRRAGGYGCLRLSRASLGAERASAGKAVSARPDTGNRGIDLPRMPRRIDRQEKARLVRQARSLRRVTTRANWIRTRKGLGVVVFESSWSGQPQVGVV